MRTHLFIESVINRVVGISLAVLVQAISLAGAFELQVLLEQGNAGYKLLKERLSL